MRWFISKGVYPSNKLKCCYVTMEGAEHEYDQEQIEGQLSFEMDLHPMNFTSIAVRVLSWYLWQR